MARLKAELAQGEHKSIQTDRIILIPGPSDEIETVRFIYDSFVHQKRTEAEIASTLNQREVLTDLVDLGLVPPCIRS